PASQHLRERPLPLPGLLHGLADSPWHYTGAEGRVGAGRIDQRTHAQARIDASCRAVSSRSRFQKARPGNLGQQREKTRIAKKTSPAYKRLLVTHGSLPPWTPIVNN